jgi:hypothetical protein
MISPTDYWTLVEPVWETISIYGSAEEFAVQYAAAPKPSRVLFAAHWCQSEVSNGGLHQFFWNSTGILAPEAVAAFKDIGMPQLASVVERATQWFGVEYPRNKEARIALLDDFEAKHPEQRNPFEELDEEFFNLLDSENGGFEAAANAFAAKQAG